MQCPNCSFNNMPGSQACARCGTSLTLTTSVVDVNPPRAGSISLALRRLLPLHQIAYAFRDRRLNLAPASLSFLDGELPPRDLIVRLVIPGWSQLRVGERWQGRLLMLGWLILLLTGLVLFGTTAGSVVLGLAFSVHTFAASDILNRVSDNRSIAAQMSRSILASIALAMLIYAPASFVAIRVASPVTPAYGSGWFSSGDTLLVNFWATPDAGSVVFYEIPYYPAPQGRERRYMARAGYTGQRIDRILAVAGDTVESRKGVFLVNGKVPNQFPLEKETLPDFKSVVEKNHVFILPSTARDLDYAFDLNTLMQMCNVPRERLYGVVWARLHPLSKISPVY